MRRKFFYSSTCSRIMVSGILFLILGVIAPVFAQVQFPQTTNADFNKGAYNDMIVASDNVNLTKQATAVGTWLTGTVLPQTLMGHKAATWNNRYVYVVGGYNNTTCTNAVYRATMQSGGISNWTTLNPLPVGLRDHAVVIGTNTIYVLGGKDESTVYNTIYYASINADGSIGTWQTSSVNLPSALWGHTAVYCNGYIYVAGGAKVMTATSARNNVYYTKVLADNTLSAFTNATNLPATRNGHTMVTNDDKVYVLGGFSDGGTKAKTVYYATSVNNGSLGSWTTATALPITVSNHSSAVINGIVTVMAGESGGTFKNTVYWADITAATLTWNLAPDVLYDYTRDGAAFASNGQICYCGGENLSNTPIHNTRYANLTLSANQKKTGYFVSNPFYELGAERIISKIEFTKSSPAGSTVSVSYRTAGNDKIWSDWTAFTSTSPITINQTKRYLQYKVSFTSNGTANPVFNDLTLFTPGTQLAGNLNAIATFTKAASPYWATADISFTEGTHTFQAGTTILFLPGVSMTVGKANIKCNGVANDSVRFMGYTNDNGLWNGIYFNPDSDDGVSSLLDFTVVAHAGNGDRAANLYCNGTNEPLIHHSTFRNSSAHGIRVNNSHITMENSVSRNNEGSGIYMENSNPSFISSDFLNNGGAGLKYSSNASVPTFSSTTCQNNLYGLYFPAPETMYVPNGTLTLTGNTYNGICIEGGTIGNNQRWYAVAYDYILLGSLTIGQYGGCRLTIEPGNTVKVFPGKSIRIGFEYYGSRSGELYAIGSADSLITFTSFNGNAGGWEGIYFEDRSDHDGVSSVLNYCVVEKGNEYNIYCENTNSVSLNNCQIKNAAVDGIRYNQSHGTYENCTISNNGRYPVYYLNWWSSPAHSNNTFTNNGVNYIALSGGWYQESRTIFKDNAEYLVLDNITIGNYEPCRLTVEPGVILNFSSGKGIKVGLEYYGSRGGELFAVGSAGNQITFKPYSGTVGDWNGIFFADQSDYNGATNHLNYCVVEKGNEYNIYCENTNSVSLNNCQIKNAAVDGIRYNQSHGTYENCTISNNGRYPVYYLNWWSSPAHSNNTFTNNGVNRITLSGGWYQESRTIFKDNAEYLVLDNITIGNYEPCRLTVEPGVILNFSSGKSIKVGLEYYGNRGGELYAVGASDSRIVFRSASGANGDWEGIFFADQSDYSGAISILKYCNVTKANEYNIRCNSTTQPTIDNCIFANSTGYGVLIESSTINISRTRISQNAGIGIYLTGSSSPVIGNADSLTCSFFSNGDYELYNNTANNINALYNFWGTVDSAMIAARIYDKSDNPAKGIVYFNKAASIPSLHLPTTTMSGWVKYANAGANPMKNATMKIKTFGGTTVKSTTTNASGNYSFTTFASGNYQMTITPSNAWGGVNATDALKILRHFARLDTLVGMKLAAADVNKSTTINGTDAMLVMRRFAGSIQSFPAGDYLYHSETINISGNAITNNIRMLCFGDVDASYGPSKKSGGSVLLEFKDTLLVSSFNEFYLPVRIRTGLDIGAISLGFYYPQDLFEILNVQLAYSNEDVIFNAENGLVKIAWCSLNPLSLNNDEIMLNVKMKALDLSGLNSGIRLVLFEESEFASEEAVSLEGVVLEIPEIQFNVTGVENISEDVPFSVFPTVVKGNEPVHLILNGDYHVTIDLINYLGQQVECVVENNFSAGSYIIPLHLSNFKSGIYILRIKALNHDNSYISVIKMVVSN